MRLAVIGNDPHYLVNFRGRLISDLAQRGHEVHALAPNLTGTALRSVQALGATGWSYPLQRQGINPIRDVVTLRGLVRILRDLHVDAAFTYTIKPLVYGAMASAIVRVPHRVAMVTGVGSAFTSRRSARDHLVHVVAKNLYRYALAGQSVVFFQNPDDEALFRRLGLLPEGADVRLVNGSGIDLGEFVPSPPPTSPITFTLVARLHREKGVREFAEAAGLVRRRHPDSRFVLVGPFEEHPNAIRREEVDRWQSEGVLSHLGFLSDVRPVLRDTSVYVLPSYREGTPRSVLEAMAVGRAIITSDAPGCRETVQPGVNGVLVPVGDARALAEAMSLFVEDTQRIETMGEASRALAERKYDVARVNATLIRALESG